MADNILVQVSKSGNAEPAVSTNGYLLIYLRGEEIKFTGSLELKALTPLLLKLAMDKLKS